ncbi:MAG: 16S rRNA (uracil(1498)-N(3))-methyltransferase [Streptosporangiaceae bacterium]
MRPPVFLADPAELARDTVVLTGAEGRHAATVRRLAPGERLDLTDGAGTLAEGRVTAVRPGTVELAVLARRVEPAPEPRLVVIQAIPKGERGELAVETMTEVGVDVIVPWAAERCVAVWRGERADKGAARWRSAAVAAAKQSRRAWFPEITPLASTAAVADRVRAARLALLLDPEAQDPLARLADSADPAGPVAQDGPDGPGGEVVLIVGPEGGVASAEAELLARCGAIGARLGPTVLRASTAGAVAAALLLSASGRWT